jgi:hypothetical protein
MQGLLAAAENGDVLAAREVLDRTAGPALGFLDKVRSARGPHRRLLKGLREACCPRRKPRSSPVGETEAGTGHDDLHERVKQVEGAVVSR